MSEEDTPKKVVAKKAAAVRSQNPRELRDRQNAAVAAQATREVPKAFAATPRENLTARQGIESTKAVMLNSLKQLDNVSQKGTALLTNLRKSPVWASEAKRADFDSAPLEALVSDIEELLNKHYPKGG